jgi:Na+/proline symporter
MSDIGILNGLGGTLFILGLFGAPGLPVGAIAGALLWRSHRPWGALAGGVAGFALSLIGWLYFSDNL